MFPCSLWGSSHSRPVLHELSQHESTPQAVVFPRLLQHGNTSTGRSPSRTGCSSGSCSLHGAPTGSQSPLRHLPAPAWVPSGCGIPTEILCPPCAAGAQLPHHCLDHRLQGNLCSNTWSSSCPFFCTDLSVCKVVPLTCSHSTLL